MDDLDEFMSIVGADVIPEYWIYHRYSGRLRGKNKSNMVVVEIILSRPGETSDSIWDINVDSMEAKDPIFKQMLEETHQRKAKIKNLYWDGVRFSELKVGSEENMPFPKRKKKRILLPIIKRIIP